MEILLALLVVVGLVVFVTHGERRNDRRISRWFDKD